MRWLFLCGKIKSEIMQQKTDFLTLIDIQEKRKGADA